METVLIIWLVIAVVALAFEVATTQLIAMYIAAGALAAAVDNNATLTTPELSDRRGARAVAAAAEQRDARH